jgi:hypothetical protein
VVWVLDAVVDGTYSQRCTCAAATPGFVAWRLELSLSGWAISTPPLLSGLELSWSPVAGGGGSVATRHKDESKSKLVQVQGGG